MIRRTFLVGIPTLAIACFLMADAPQANAQGFSLQIGGCGVGGYGYSSFSRGYASPYSIHRGHSIGYGSYYRGRSIGYGTAGRYNYHPRRPHLDYFPPQVVPHRGHYDVIPGHYHLHHGNHFH